MANELDRIKEATANTKKWIEDNKLRAQAPQAAPAVSAAEPLNGLGEKLNLPGTEKSDVQNLMTGEYLPTNSPYLDKYRQANEALNRLGEYFDGTDYNFQDFREQAGKDYPVLNEVYGDMPGIKRGFDNPELMTRVKNQYQINKTKAEKDALAAAQAEADKDVTITRGDRNYTVTKQNADEIKELMSLYASATDNPEVQKKVVASLVEKLNAAGLDITIDPNNPPKNYDELEALVLGGDNGLDRYRDMAAILQEASRDRTPKVPEHKTVQELAYERMEKQYAIDRDREARRLQAERLGHGIADLSATIGDMVRASEGAPVNPRDWQRIYDSLTAQEKANINNYQVRMAKLNEDRRAERMAAAKAAADAQKAAQDRATKIAIEKAKITSNEKIAGDRNTTNIKIGEGHDEARIKAAQIAAAAKQNGARPVRFTAFGQSYDVFGDERSFTGMMNDILSVLNNRSNTADGKKFQQVSFKPKEIQSDPQGFYNRRIKDLLRPENKGQYKPSAIKQIEDIINVYKFGSKSGENYYGGVVPEGSER